MTLEQQSLETIAIHAGEQRLLGAAMTPIFQTSTYAYRGGEDYHDIRYLRLNNTPNHDTLHAKLAAMESGEAALVTASGMAAIAGSLLGLLNSGDHILIQRCPYGGTSSLLSTDLARFNVTYDTVDANDPDSWATSVQPSTRIFYVESMTNPLLEIPDFEAVVAFARQHNLIAIIDNTFASPVNFRPLDLGFDLCVHSCTKYLNGHSDIVAGAVIGNGALVNQIKHCLDHLGGSLDPNSCFLLQRGIKTLAVRMRQHNESALAIAQYLASHAKVAKVYYPGLPSHPQYERAKEFFSGCGGVVCFELQGSSETAKQFIEAVRLPLHAPSLGGVESLITCPATSTHGSMSDDAKRDAGLSDRLLRLSVGLEATEDLIADIAQALAR